MPVECMCQNPACGKIFHVTPSRKYIGRGKFCSHACQMHTTISSQYFWNKVNICEHGFSCIECCWPWIRSLSTVGYGQLTITNNGKKITLHAHRIAWEFAYNCSFPNGLWALHTCDLRACCNPWYIYPGTAQDNSNDACYRQRFPDRRGEKSYNAKLTEIDVREIRHRYVSGETQAIIANYFGIHKSHVSRIVQRKKWTNI